MCKHEIMLSSYRSAWEKRIWLAFFASPGTSLQKEFLEAGKKRLAGDTGRQATSGEVKASISQVTASPDA